MSRAVGQLEKMYNTLNLDLWGGQLPTPIITVQSKPGTYGHTPTHSRGTGARSRRTTAFRAYLQGANETTRPSLLYSRSNELPTVIASGAHISA